MATTLDSRLPDGAHQTGRADALVVRQERYVQAQRGPGNQAIERIDNCIDLREKQTKPVSDWLTRR